MLETIENHPADVAAAEVRLFPDEAVPASDQLVEENALPYDLVGAEPEPILVRVVERFGLPQRVLVAPAADQGDGAYRVLEDGRWIRAAREAGLLQIPVRVLEVSGLSADLLTLILNQPRPANVGAQVDALERLLAAGISEGELARASGTSKSRLSRLARLLELDADLRQALREDRIKGPVAFAAADLPGDVQQALAATLERDGKLTGAQVRKVRERMGAEDAENAEAAQVGAGSQPDPRPAPQGPPQVATEQVRHQATELLKALPSSDLPTDLRQRLAGVLLEVGQMSAEAR